MEYMLVNRSESFIFNTLQVKNRKSNWTVKIWISKWVKRKCYCTSVTSILKSKFNFIEYYLIILNIAIYQVMYLITTDELKTRSGMSAANLQRDEKQIQADE